MVEVLVTVKDGSDNGGLSKGQTVNIRSMPGKWVVIEVGKTDEQGRHYRVRREGNRKERRKASSNRGKK